MTTQNLPQATVSNRVALITPVRDEAKYIGAMIESIAQQETTPATWAIVDDGSTDGTPEIVAEYIRKHSFITLLRLPQRRDRQPGGESAIAHGLKQLRLAEFHFIGRFDADLVFERDYMTRILREFSLDPKLGIAGGCLYIQKNSGWELEKAPEYHVRGALKMYRRECFEQIGGLSTRIGWDTMDEVSAWTKGWTTKSFFQLRVIHRRPTGEGLSASRIHWQRGKAEYFTWSHPLFVLVKTLNVAHKTRNLTAALSFLAGFVCAHVRSGGRLRDRIFVEMRRRQQMGRMSSFLKARVRMLESVTNSTRLT